MKVAVIDPMASLRRGLFSALSEAGYEPFEPRDVEVWICSDDAGAVIVALLGEVEAKRIKALRDLAPSAPIVALLSDVTVDTYGWALRTGASAAAARDAPSEEIVAVLEAACAGQCILPIALAQLLALAAEPREHPPLLAAEIVWLSALARGVTVTQLAQETELFRA